MVSMALLGSQSFQRYLQRSEHVTGRDAVDSDTGMRPLDGERRGHVPDSGFGGVVGSLRLWDVDNGAAHGADHDNAAIGLALHQVLRDTDGEQPGAVDVDTPQLLHAVVWVVYGWEVLCESG